MGEHIFDEDRFPGVGRVWEIFRDAVVEADFALFNEHHDGGGDELLAHRAGLKKCFGFYRDVQLHVSEAIAFGEKDLTAVVNADLRAGDALLGHLSVHILVDGGDLRGR